MIDLGNKHLNEQKMVPLVARFKKYLSFIWSPLFFYYWGRILFNIKYTKLFIKSMFLMLLFWSTDKLRKLGQQTITAERAIWIFSCSLIPAENCLKICHCFGQSPSCNKKIPAITSETALNKKSKSTWLSLTKSNNENCSFRNREVYKSLCWAIYSESCIVLGLFAMLSWYIWAHVLTSIVPSQNKYNPEQSTAAGMPWHSAQNKGILIYLLWSQRNKTPYNTTKFSCLFFAILTHIDIQLLCSSDSNRSDQVDLSSGIPIYKFSYWQSKNKSPGPSFIA